MKKTKKTKQLQLARHTVRRLSDRALDGVRGGTGEPSIDACDFVTNYTGACAQPSNHCASN